MCVPFVSYTFSSWVCHLYGQETTKNISITGKENTDTLSPWGVNSGPQLARQVFYHWSHSTSPFLCWVFSRWGGLTNYLPGLPSNCDPPYLCLFSMQDYRHEAPASGSLSHGDTSTPVAKTGRVGCVSAFFSPWSRFPITKMRNPSSGYTIWSFRTPFASVSREEVLKNLTIWVPSQRKNH
jgi:hypothetical protein